AARNGWALGMHVVGDAAMDEFLAALDRVAARFDLRPLRWTAEHAFFCSPQQCARLQRLGVGVTVQPALLYDFGHVMVDRGGRERMQGAPPVRDLVAAGLSAGGGSDGPFVELSPLLGLQTLITRETRLAGRIGVDQAVDVDTGLAMYTRFNAEIT